MMAGSPRNSIGNVRSDMDITYPEHLSRLHRHSILTEYPKPPFNAKKSKNTRNRRGNRYRTQPVTFGEIQEVDEENTAIENLNLDDQDHQKSASFANAKLELDFFRFSKALEAKCKKTADSSDTISPIKDVLGKTNGMQPVHAKPEDPSRWTEYAREGSV